MDTTPPVKPSRWRRLRLKGAKHAVDTLSPPPSPLSASGDVLRQGFLSKKGHRLPTTKERFFILRPRLLSYFRIKQHSSTTEIAASSASASASASAEPSLTVKARQLRGVIELAPTDLITPVAKSRHWFLLQKHHGPDGKPYKLELRASSPEERQEWIDALRTAARDPLASAAQTARTAERERQLTRTLTMLRVRDATLLSTVLRQHHLNASTTKSHTLTTTTSAADLRASFQVFHELVLLQSLVQQIETDWGPPATWTCDQYDTLVHSIALADHQANSTASIPNDSTPSVLRMARAFQYAFEEVAENQHKLLARRQRTASTVSDANNADSESHYGSFVTPSPRVRCPTIYSYLSTFERFALPSDRRSTDSDRTSSVSSSDPPSGRSSLHWDTPLSPRSATLAKYAHLYLEEEGHRRPPWRWDRVPGDDLTEENALAKDEASLTHVLVERFTQDQIYAYVRHHTLLFLNPQRMLKTAKFTSIYDEHVVLTYAQTPFAPTTLAPHPFAMAKQALFRLFYKTPTARLSMILSGDSGSGKTELSKELLKYTVLTAQPSGSQSPKVVLYTSSTKSTFQMRNEETRTLDLLHAKGVRDYEVVLLDLTPEKWPEMTRISNSKRLPQVHIDGRFFGFYDTLQRLEDEEQLRLYIVNPHAATKLTSVLDANILLEAFAHAATPLNPNSSRYAKRLELQITYGRDPSQYQVCGATIAPCLLEKSRVTNVGGGHQRNFHVLYALVHGVNTATNNQQLAWAKTLALDGCTSESFRYLSMSDKTTTWTRTKDAERFQHIVQAMETIAMDVPTQEAIFRVLSAVLWLGNLDFDGSTSTSTELLVLKGETSTTETRPIEIVIQELLMLPEAQTLQALLLQRRVDMASTKETFDVQLSGTQARHTRDTLARFLYEMAFHYVVAQLNHATQCAPAVLSHTQTLSIVDLFGFEAFPDASNSLEQLCINYLTEKLAVAARQLVSSLVSAPLQDEMIADPVLTLFESPLGIFATLEEQTVLHQSEGETVVNDQRKNDVFVRYLYQRNPSTLRPQPSQLKQHALQFLVPHARGVVTYDAHDFVKKNADFLPSRLIATLESSQNTVLREMASAMKPAVPITRSNGTRGTPTSGSLTTQFRTQIQQQLGLLDDPLFLHCFRANRSSAAWTSGAVADVDADVLQRQVQAHRLASILEVSARDDTSFFEVTMDATLFQTRFQCLARKGEHPTTLASLCRLLGETLLGVLDLSDTTQDDLLLVEDASVRVRTLQIAETLELLLATRQFEAVTYLQATWRMVRLRRWYTTIQADRRDLTRELLELYGPHSTRKVARTLLKYTGGRETELRAKLAAKKQEKDAIAAIAAGLEAFLAHGRGGGLDPELLEIVLRDPEIQQQIVASDSRIIVALREMSLHPQDVLPRQLANPEFRTFYQRMLMLLQTANQNQHQQNQQTVDDEEPTSLEDRVRMLATTQKSVWMRVAHTPDQAWTNYHDRLDEIGDEPEMLLFYADDDEFMELFSTFVDAVDAQTHTHGVADPNSKPATGQDELQLEDLLTQLQGVELNATLLAATQGDPYFVNALQSPLIVAAVHQLMTDRQAFTATQSGLQSPLLREFFFRLVRLSEETRKHH